jgi:hypothetical protein
MERREATRPAVRELLCDRCGYSLEGTPNTPVCPECGLDFAASRAMRVGSPWQRRPSLWSWLKTVVLMIFRPRRTLGIVSFDNDDSNFRLFLCNVLIVPGCVFMLAAVVGLVSCMLAPASVQERIPVSGAVFVASIVLVAGLVMWLAAGLALYLSGRQVIRWVCRPSPEIWRGSHVLAVHASCVVAPASAVLLVDLFLDMPEYCTPLLAAGVLWFVALCLVASRWPDQTPPARGR